MHISKSRFLQYIQCPKRFWLNCYTPELADERDMTVFTNGTRVGETARQLFPGGTLAEHRKGDRLDIGMMLEETQKHIDVGTRIVYEAAFAADNLMAICDILVKTDEGYEIYEVKSSGSMKDVYLADVSFQYHVLKVWGLNISKVFLTHINTSYLLRGKLDLNELFFHNDVTEQVKKIESEIEEAIPDIFDVYKLGVEPKVEIDTQCESPYTCEFMGYCFRHIGENSVFELAGMQQKKKYELYHKGLVYFSDIIGSEEILKKNIMTQVDVALSGEPYIDKEEIREFLDTLHYPLYFLDFETINPAIPLYENTSPYEQIPTQYSLHYIQTKGGELKHNEFLAKEGQDPRRDLALGLIKSIPEDACVLAYHMSFEKKVIAKLANAFPELREDLMKIHENIRDLIIPFRKRYYYTKDMKGKSSIKSVLPALYPDDPELSYNSLEGVHNGNEASNAYLALTEMDPDERESTRRSLLEYCKLDTLAMVRIWEKLKTLV